MDEPREPSGLKFIEIEAPIELAEGQDFYDQPPFDGILQTVIEGTNIAPNLLRSGLTRASLYDASQLSTPSWEILAGRKIFKQKIDESAAKNLAFATKIVVVGLSAYPEWKEYIRNKLDKGIYRPDGQFALRKEGKRPKYIPTPSYAKWVTERLVQDGIINQLEMQSMLQEAFPGDVEATMSHITGHTTGWRRWRITEASEIARRK